MTHGNRNEQLQEVGVNRLHRETPVTQHLQINAEIRISICIITNGNIKRFCRKRCNLANLTPKGYFSPIGLKALSYVVVVVVVFFFFFFLILH
jgi:hypothetical protein